MTSSVLLLALLIMIAASSCVTPTVGIDSGRLRACPDSPNCVCSEDAADEDSFISPFEIPAGIAPEVAFQTLAGLVESRAKIESRSAEYLHAVFTTRILRFKDDLELRLDGGAGAIHVRSASRVGYSDLGKNRKRVEALREAYRAALP